MEATCKFKLGIGMFKTAGISYILVELQIKMELQSVLILFISHGLRYSLANDYYGTYVGDFNNRFHGVSGEVYAVDSRTLFIKDFR